MHVAVNGVDLNYETAGEGTPLLWLHGFMGAGLDWQYIFGAPPSGFQLIAPDLRGHGASTNPSNDFSFREAAHDVLGLLDELQVNRLGAIGISGGGLTLLHMATLRPALVDSMVIVSAPPVLSRPGARDSAPGVRSDVRCHRAGADAQAPRAGHRAASATPGARPRAC